MQELAIFQEALSLIFQTVLLIILIHGYVKGPPWVTDLKGWVARLIGSLGGRKRKSGSGTGTGGNGLLDKASDIVEMVELAEAFGIDVKGMVSQAVGSKQEAQTGGTIEG